MRHTVAASAKRHCPAARRLNAKKGRPRGRLWRPRKLLHPSWPGAKTPSTPPSPMAGRGNRWSRRRRGGGGRGESMRPRESEGTANGGDEDDDGAVRSEGSGPQSLTRARPHPGADCALRTQPVKRQCASRTRPVKRRMPPKHPALPPQYTPIACRATKCPSPTATKGSTNGSSPSLRIGLGISSTSNERSRCRRCGSAIGTAAISFFV